MFRNIRRLGFNPGSFPWDSSLQRRISVTVIVGLVLAMGILAYLGLTALDRSTQVRLQERLTIAQLAAEYETQVLTLALNSVVHAAALTAPLSPSGIAPNDLDSMKLTLSQVGLTVVDVFILDRQGLRTWSTLDWDGTWSWNIALEESVNKTMATGKASISGVTAIPSIDEPVVLLAAPLGGSDGVLVAAVDLTNSNITDFIEPLELGETGYAELVDDKGLVVSRTIPGQTLGRFEKSDHPEKFAELIASGKPTVGTCHRCHVKGQQTERRKDVLAFAPLTTPSWGIVVRQSEEEALAPTRDLRQKLLIAGSVMSAITLALIWVATSNVVTRIRSLRTASLRMASGDLSSPITIKGRDELGTLARTMESTRLELKASYEAVEQRTQELSALLAISKTLTAVSDLSEVLDSVLAKVVETVSGSEGGLLLLRTDETDDLAVRSIVGLQPVGELEGVSVSTEPGKREKPEVSCSILPDLPPEVHLMTESACARVLELAPVRSLVRNAAGAPLRSREHLVGILVLVNFKDGVPFTHNDLNLLQTLVNEIAVVVENVRLSRQEEEARLLRETDRLKSEFLSIVSHELRTPLTSVKGYTTSLLREDVEWDPETQREFLVGIDERADELRDLIDKVLQMARVEAGGLTLLKEPVLMNRLARDVVIDSSTNDSGHSFEFDFPDPFPVVEGDLHYLGIVLRNLVDNAVNYSPQGGTIVISGRMDNGHMTIGVRDQGVGIHTKDLDKVFDRFYRVDGELANIVGGSGLGLAVVRALMEAHGGDTWAESKIGQGSSFFFSLPMDGEHDG